MSSHTDTSIYIEAFKLAQLIAAHAPKMPKDFKALYGSEMRVQTMGVLRDIRFANRARGEEKTPHITRIIDRLDDLNDLFRIAVELGHLKRPHYAAAIQHTGSVGRQAGGLRKKYAPAA